MSRDKKMSAPFGFFIDISLSLCVCVCPIETNVFKREKKRKSVKMMCPSCADGPHRTHAHTHTSSNGEKSMDVVDSMDIVEEGKEDLASYLGDTVKNMPDMGKYHAYGTPSMPRGLRNDERGDEGNNERVRPRRFTGVGAQVQ